MELRVWNFQLVVIVVSASYLDNVLADNQTNDGYKHLTLIKSLRQDKTSMKRSAINSVVAAGTSHHQLLPTVFLQSSVQLTTYMFSRYEWKWKYRSTIV